MFQKYTDALALMDLTIAAKDAVIAEHGETDNWWWSDKGAEIRKPINTAWDTLYTYLHSNFVAPASTQGHNFTKEEQAAFDSEVEEMVAMFDLNREPLEEAVRKIPPVIAEVAFPVYVARHLLWTKRMPVSVSELTTFNEFHQRYGYMIIRSSDKRVN